MKLKILLLKIIVAVVLLLNVCMVSAQNAIGAQITQDAKLAVMNDDHYNKPFTPDIQAKIVLQGNDTETGYTVVAVKYEFADLYGGDYTRFGFEAGYAFHLPILKTDFAVTAGYGYAYRWDERYDNFEFSAEVKLPVAGPVSLIGLFNTNQRKELPNKKWGINLGAGLRVDISTNWQKKQAEKGTRF